MDNPLLFLLWLIIPAVLAFGVWFLIKKAFQLWRARKQSKLRRLVEDALRLIYSLEYEGQPPDKYRLAIELDVNLQAVQDLISHLQNQNLIFEERGKLSLTNEGRHWALHVIRAHRLWERYLADEARMPLEKIHSAAHTHEHVLSVDEVNSLDAVLGYPAINPHGDPIPSAAGFMRRTYTTRSLGEMDPGQHGKIVHLEDKPPLAYAQLLADGLFIGQHIIMIDKDSTRVVFASDDKEFSLARTIAEKVDVHIEEQEAEPDLSVIPLDSLEHGKVADIVSINDRCQGFTRRRFLDLGLTPGTPIYPELENVFKDPRAYRVRGTLIALRSDQAALICVRPNHASRQ